MEERDKKTELMVGLFLFIGLVMLGLLILQFGSVRELFKSTYEITVSFPDGTGIKEGTPVMLGGSRIGKVPRKPVLNETFNGVVIPLEVYQQVKIPSDARFSIGTSGLLGDSYIEIRPTGKETTTYIEHGAKLVGTPSGGLGALQNSAEVISKKVELAVEDIRSLVLDLKVSVKKVNEGALSDKGVEDLKGSLAHLNSVMTRLDEKTLSEDTSRDVKEAVASFKDAAKSLKDSVEKLNPAFTKVESVVTKLDGVVTKADTVMVSANDAMKSIDESADSLGKAARDIQKGEGLLPALIHDATLKRDFKMLISNMRERGILFYKDEAGKAQSARPTPGPIGTKR